MSEGEAESMADETIAYWQIRGVCVVDVAAEFRCYRSWAAVRERMVWWLLDADEQRLAA